MKKSSGVIATDAGNDFLEVLFKIFLSHFKTCMQ